MAFRVAADEVAAIRLVGDLHDDLGAGGLGALMESVHIADQDVGCLRLAVIDGAVGPEEVRQIVAALEEKERVTVVAKVVLPGAEEALAKLSCGSRIRKAPRDLLTGATRRALRHKGARL